MDRKPNGEPRFDNRTLKYVILALALGTCAFGIWRGETADVLQKAAAICLECCGIG